jgi:hypothetical protein
MGVQITGKGVDENGELQPEYRYDI